MSIINNVLKDLDKQQQDYQQNHMPTSASLETKSASKSLFYALSMFIILVIALFVYQQPLIALITAEETIVALAKKETIKEIVVVDKQVAEVVENRLKGFQLNELSNGIELEFKLDKEPVSYVKAYFKNKYVYHLSQVSNQLKVPQIMNQQWLKSLQIEESDKGIDLIILSAKDTLLNTRWDVSKNDGSRWILSIVAKPKPVIFTPIKSDLSSTKKPLIKENSAQVVAIKETVKKPSPEKVVVKEEATKASVAKVKPSTKPIKLVIKPKRVALTPLQQFDKAKVLLQKQQWGLAQIKLESLLNSAVDFNVRMALLPLYKKLGIHKQRDVLIKNSLLLYPGNIDLIYLSAKNDFQNARYESALEKLSHLSKNNIQTFALLGQSYQRVAKHTQAIASFKQALALKSQAHLWLSMALSQEKIKHYQSAITAYNKAVVDKNISIKLKQFAQGRIQKLQKIVNK